jgi:F-type H+-transporting ATPase subunit gamma
VESLEQTRRRIDSAKDLHGIVRTMKTLSAANIRQYERAVEAVGVYYRTVDTALRIVLQDQNQQAVEPDRLREPRTGAVIFGTDQGMCGQFNELIVSYALDDLSRRGPDAQRPLLLVIGVRAAARIEEAKWAYHDIFSVPSSVSGIIPSVQSILLHINAWREEQAVSRVMVYNNYPVSGSAYQPGGMQLIPVDMSRFQSPAQESANSRSLPLYTMDRARLLSALVRQYLFVQLYRASAESLASENTSRLITMQSAEKNIDERLAELNGIYHSRRQEAITGELLDVVSGFEVLSK